MIGAFAFFCYVYWQRDIEFSNVLHLITILYCLEANGGKISSPFSTLFAPANGQSFFFFFSEFFFFVRLFRMKRNLQPRITLIQSIS